MMQMTAMMPIGMLRLVTNFMTTYGNGARDGDGDGDMVLPKLAQHFASASPERGIADP